MKMTLSQRIARGLVYALLLIVFCGPFWGIVATAFTKNTVQPGQLVLWPSQPTLDHFIYAWTEVKVWIWSFWVPCSQRRALNVRIRHPTTLNQDLHFRITPKNVISAPPQI